MCDSAADIHFHDQQLWRILINGVICVVTALLEYLTDFY